jgi:phosphate transport system substrate-binding protein
VDSLGHSRRAEEIRTKLIHRLERSHQIQVVTDRAKADASITGTAQMWTIGETSLSPHSHVNQPVFEGYLSVELTGKNRQTLWSYLATPNKFPWSGVSDDLARQIVSRLLQDISESGPQLNSSTSASTANAGATLKGAGATFPAPLYRKWFQSFEEIRPEVHIDYDAVGSGEGIRRVSDGLADFGASEMPLTDKAMAETHHQFIQIPVVLGAVVPIYNVPQLRRRINFTPEILAGIYLGKIKRWNDAQIRSANPGVSLPNAEITVVHRSDASGTSFVWTDYLSKINPEWKTSVGADVSVQWPVGVGAAYNEGVAGTVQHTPNSIGYVEFIYAIQHELSFAAVKNSAGRFIKADLASVTEAARSSGTPDRSFRLSITDAPGDGAYPIATYTWLLLPEQSSESTNDKSKRAALLDLLRWMLSDGQKSCSALGYAPLPADVAKSALQAAEKPLLSESASF